MAVGNWTLPTDALQNCNGGFFICMATWASDVTTGLWWFLALFAFCVIIFMASARLGTSRAFGFSSFVGMLGGIFLAVLKLVPWALASVFIILGVIGLAIRVISEKG